MPVSFDSTTFPLLQTPAVEVELILMPAMVQLPVPSVRYASPGSGVAAVDNHEAEKICSSPVLFSLQHSVDFSFWSFSWSAASTSTSGVLPPGNNDRPKSTWSVAAADVFILAPCWCPFPPPPALLEWRGTTTLLSNKIAGFRSTTSSGSEVWLPVRRPAASRLLLHEVCALRVSWVCAVSYPVQKHRTRSNCRHAFTNLHPKAKQHHKFHLSCWRHLWCGFY